MEGHLFEGLLREVGGFGRYQILLVVFLAMSSFPTAFHNMGMVFYGGTPNHRCEVMNSSTLVDGNSSRILKTDKSVSECFIEIAVDRPRTNANDLVYDVTTRKVACESWEYDDSLFESTMVTEWNLVCDRKWLVATAQSIYMLGFFFGCIIFGYLSDRFGRRLVYYGACAIQAVLGVAASFAPNYTVLVIIRCFVGAMTGGLVNSSFTMCQEITVPEWRAFAGVVNGFTWAIGYVMLGGIAYYIREWRTLAWVTSAIGAANVLLFWFVPESPRWLIIRGRIAEGEAILKLYARRNGVRLSDDFKVSHELIEKEEEERTKHSAGSVADLVRTPNVRRTTFIVWLNWFVASLVFFGLAYSAGTLGGNIYLNNTLLGVIEIGVYLVFPFILRLGRRMPFAGFGILAGLFCLVVVAMPTEPSITKTILSVIGKCGVLVTFTIAFIYTAEIYPTPVRNVGIGVASMWARIGAMVAPFIISLGGPTPYIIFGAVALVAGLFSLLLPETYCRPLPDTVEMAEKMNVLLPWRQILKWQRKAPKPVEETMSSSETSSEEMVKLNRKNESI